MLLSTAKLLEVGALVYDKHHKKFDRVTGIIQKPENETNLRIKYPLIQTETEPTGMSYLLFQFASEGK